MNGPRYHRTRPQDQHLVAFECRSCGWVSFPEHVQICKRCAETPAAFEEVILQPRGVVQTFVAQEYLPEEFEVPQLLAIVDMPQEAEGEPARVYGLLTETELADVDIGTEVVARFRRMFTDGDRGVYGFKFSRPRGEER